MKKKRTTMKKPHITDTTQKFEQAIAESHSAKFILHLYISGVTSQSTHAIMSIRKICEEHLEGRYQLKVIDVYQQPALAKEEQIIVVPTLIKSLPLPLRRLIGDLSNNERILVGLGLKRVDNQIPT
ncbi:MAG: circadian clock KaiB family protein [Ignavibacteriales bacterium]|jgi:circadian clock protein KaiB